MPNKIQLPDYLPANIPRLVYSNTVTEETAKRIVASLMRLKDEKKIVKDIQLETPYYDLNIFDYQHYLNMIKCWANNNCGWPEDLEWITIELANTKDPAKKISIEIGPSPSGGWLIESYWY